jgi:hypothetical protein
MASLDDFDDLDPFEIATEETINGIKYWKKTNKGADDNTVEMWNRLYNKKNGALLRFEDAGIIGKYNYFPNLGVAIPLNTARHEICSIVNEKLNALGLVHDEIRPDKCNLTNVRMLNGEYYPIDMIKIYPHTQVDMSDNDFLEGMEFGGKRKSKVNRKRKSKVNRKRKSKVRKLKLLR